MNVSAAEQSIGKEKPYVAQCQFEIFSDDIYHAAV